MPIKRPQFEGKSYQSGHKKTYGMAMLAVVDSDRKFLYVNCGNTGRASDSMIFQTCRLKREIDSVNTVFSEETRILVDSAFAEAPFIRKSTARIGAESARVIIEHAFGIFKQQNRLFLKRYMKYSHRSDLSPTNHTLKLNAAVIVYNLARIVDHIDFD